MKPGKVDQYLNKRKDREGRLAEGGKLQSELPPDPHDHGSSISPPSKEHKPEKLLGVHIQQSTSHKTEAKKDYISLSGNLLDSAGSHTTSHTNQRPI